jgi:hypothetical protein
VKLQLYHNRLEKMNPGNLTIILEGLKMGLLSRLNHAGALAGVDNDDDWKEDDYTQSNPEWPEEARAQPPDIPPKTLSDCAVFRNGNFLNDGS